MRRELDGVGLWLDNAPLTVAETVDYILQSLRKEDASIWV